MAQTDQSHINISPASSRPVSLMTIANPELLKSALIATPIGPVKAIADEHFLYFLQLDGWRPSRSSQLTSDVLESIVSGYTAIHNNLENELQHYFKGTLTAFETPLFLHGTDFQKKVWSKLIEIPYGQTRSYLQIAQALEKPTAFRAVAQANGANNLALIIPCHRVINHNGNLGGYASGTEHKAWLLAREKQFTMNLIFMRNTRGHP